ncbi:helix-turn-helix domain-containing protein [Kurthia sibirica]|uniref:XRE family transcriptional regulator n=1 Tax=Kurthia sibirica TaxID=202750 RepID=A0A2U3AQ03_9BACL|nr:helix-turn-helix transcriptional regulator [Kurthia sibirica]PWI26628.1 XRE family transcriptional regulator [Kurthia sibirica]GEK32885.1 hypothetical protein KSI01_04180 [Kurthia sibirica]
MFDQYAFGEQLKLLRELSNHSMLSLAKEIGTSASRIKSWEVGESVPSAKWIVRLSQALKISADDLLLNIMSDVPMPQNDIEYSRRKNVLLRDLSSILPELTKQDLLELYTLAEIKITVKKDLVEDAVRA